MFPGPNPYRTDVYGAPPGEEANCHPLEITKGTDPQGRNYFASCWDCEPLDIHGLKNIEGARLWVTLIWHFPLANRISIGSRPCIDFPGFNGMIERSKEWGDVYTTKYFADPEQVEKLEAGERLWLVVWSDTLPMACVESALAPYHRYA